MFLEGIKKTYKDVIALLGETLISSIKTNIIIILSIGADMPVQTV